MPAIIPSYVITSPEMLNRVYGSAAHHLQLAGNGSTEAGMTICFSHGSGIGPDALIPEFLGGKEGPGSSDSKAAPPEFTCFGAEAPNRGLRSNWSRPADQAMSMTGR